MYIRACERTKAGMEHAVIEKTNPVALSEEQKTKLNKYKIQARKDNEVFLRKHPEVSCLISDFLHEVGPFSLAQSASQIIIVFLST